MRRLALVAALAVVVGVVTTALATAPGPPGPRPRAVPPARTVPPRQAAVSVPADSGWCGRTESSTDRPDALAGAQIHVLYAYPPGGDDHFAEWAPRIAEEVAAMEQWWRGQDPTRAPRFDLAAFPGCTAPLGTLDLSSVQLARPVGDFLTPTGVRRDVFRAALGPGFDRTGKIYLVFLDATDPNRRACGVDSVTGAVVFLGERVRCPSFATAATHELLHALGAVFGTSTLPPHACHDGAHVCDRDDDVLARGQVGPETLAAAVLDAGRDDYYGTTGRSYDVRSSPYLRHLDTP